MTSSVRFVFGEFVVSPRQRVLLREGRPVQLIPRYFDLLLLLIVRRHDAVSKDAIFAEVWSDVVVSDGALSQAIRTLRRTLGDDVREPRFIRTVSRHGYQFVYREVIEEADEGALPRQGQTAPPSSAVEPLVEQLLTATDREDARDLAEQLHALGTSDAMAQLTARPHHATAVALMRDARWSVPEAGDVPILSDTEAPGAVLALVRLRLADVKGAVMQRWAHAAGAGIAGGVMAGLAGGLALYFASGARTPLEAVVALAAIGALTGGLGAAGIGAGLAGAEVVARSRRTIALIVCGALSGAFVAAVAGVVMRATLGGLFGQHGLPGGNALDGLVLGALTGLGYGLMTPRSGGGLATPRGGQRLAVAGVVGLCGAIGGVLLTGAGRPLVGGLVHEIAQSSQNAELGLEPLGRLIGEPDFGPLTRALLSAFEGGVFGFSLGWGLTHRPTPKHEKSLFRQETLSAD